MPKASTSSLPLSGLFAVAKPSGPTSMSVLTDIKKLVGRSRLFVEPAKIKQTNESQKKGRKHSRDPVKIGQGGTLDPLADGVLVVGIGKGTKKLSQFLDCTKEYYTTCLLGCETDTYDSEGSRVRLAPWHHVTKEMIETALPTFTGEITQTPPIFSALKMDGKALYEYARKGIPLPRPIEPRKVTVHSLELVEWKGAEHSFTWPEKSLSEEQKKAVETALSGVDDSISLQDEVETPNEDEKPSAFVLRMKVSGGTYVRSIVHDLAHHLKTAGHVVTLTRSRQGSFVLDPSEEEDIPCVPWDVFQRASEDPDVKADEDGWVEWEREVLERLQVVEK